MNNYAKLDSINTTISFGYAVSSSEKIADKYTTLSSRD